MGQNGACSVLHPILRIMKSEFYQTTDKQLWRKKIRDTVTKLPCLSHTLILE